MEKDGLKRIEAEWRGGSRSSMDFFPHLSAWLARQDDGQGWTFGRNTSLAALSCVEEYGLQLGAGEEFRVVLRDEYDDFRARFGPSVGFRIFESVEEARLARRAELGPKPVVGDPWLMRMGFFDNSAGAPQFRSLGQRYVLHEMEDMQGGDVLVGVLPTGEGKSLCVHRLLDLGKKLVVVVVPTIALAIDQELEARGVVPSMPDHALAYRPDDTDSSDGIIDRISSGEQKVVFASPEALFGRLKMSLLAAARSGQVAAFVIDEAHMIDAWGVDFRIEFQLLSSFRSALSQAARGGKFPPPCTIFLSATLTQAGLERIRRAFAVDSDSLFVLAGSLRLRKEAHCAIAKVSEADRRENVEFLIRRLPRPLYVFATKREDVEAWRIRLQAMGCDRIGVCHGGTSRWERSQLLEDLRSDPRRVEVVVGNAAFGLGINVRDVRSVLHLCVPENLDRYYQEMGRSGRDWRRVAAIMLWTDADRSVASSVGSRKLITVEKGFKRWSKMQAYWQSRPGGRQGVQIGGQAASNVRHQEWDRKTLLLLQLAGLVEFEDKRWVNGQEVAEIRVRNPEIGDFATWENLVEPVRVKLKKEATDGIGSMQRVLDDPEALDDELAEVYALAVGEDVRWTPSVRGVDFRWRERVRRPSRRGALGAFMGLDELTAEQLVEVVGKLVSDGHIEWRCDTESMKRIWGAILAIPEGLAQCIRFEDPGSLPLHPWVEVRSRGVLDVGELHKAAIFKPGVAVFGRSVRSSHPGRSLRMEFGNRLGMASDLTEE